MSAPTKSTETNTRDQVPCTLNFRATFHDNQMNIFIILEELITVCKKHKVYFISTDLNDPKDSK